MAVFITIIGSHKHDCVYIYIYIQMMGTLQGFRIYKKTKAGNQINDRLTVRENAIFETIVQEDPYRGRAAPPQTNS